MGEASEDVFRFNPKASVTLHRLGAEAIPLLVIDDVCADPDGVVAYASASEWAAPDGTYYPGLNAPLPEAYADQISIHMRGSLQRAFGLDQRRALICRGFFALATWSLAEFGPWQRIPHYDHATPGVLAMVHYLSRTSYGGTAFFRHDATGFEHINESRRAPYLDLVAPWLDAHSARLPACVGPTTPGYTMHNAVAFQFNRAVVYPSACLHCALFTDTPFSTDPRRGRLTVNTFLQAG